MKKVHYLCYLIVVLTMISALVGLFYTTGSGTFVVENIYGESIELYGDGIYTYNSVLKVGANKGTDLVMLVVAVFFGLLTSLTQRASIYRFWQVGALSGLLYYSACLVFGVTFNRLFPVYVLLFSSSLFALVFLLSDLVREDNVPEALIRKGLKGTALFILISGSSVLVWLEFILPAVMTGAPLSHIEIYTTEPTFVLDLGIVLPAYIGCGVALLRKKAIGFKLAPILLTFILIVGLTVIGQNIFQSSMGISIPLRQLLSLVVSFVLLGIIATILNVRFYKLIRAERS